MKLKSYILTLLSLCLFYLTGCGLINDDLCGIEKYWSEYLISADHLDGKIKLVYNELNGNTRTLIYEDLNTPQDICTEAHIKSIRFWVIFISGIPQNMKIYGNLYWGFFGRGVELKPSQGFAAEESIFDIGIKQAYPNGGPGSVSLQISFVFPTLGSLELDKSLVESNLQDGYIYMNYHVHL